MIIGQPISTNQTPPVVSQLEEDPPKIEAVQISSYIEGSVDEFATEEE